jgi:hypothetical protein
MQPFSEAPEPALAKSQCCPVGPTSGNRHDRHGVPIGKILIDAVDLWY